VRFLVMAFTEVGRRGQTPREELIMTEDKTRKIAIRERMAATGEPYNVARRAVEDSRQLAAADPGVTEDRDTAPAASSPPVFVSTTGQRAEFLASSVDPVPLSQPQAHPLLPAWPEPRHIGSIGWFASPDDIGRALAGLQQFATQPALAPLGPILSANDAGIGLDPAQWPTVGSTGGFEPGILAAGYLATDNEGQSFVVVAMLSKPAEALPFPSAVTGIQAIIRAAFDLVR
jgi:hypothetical protein